MTDLTTLLNLGPVNPAATVMGLYWASYRILVVFFWFMLQPKDNFRLHIQSAQPITLRSSLCSRGASLERHQWIIFWWSGIIINHFDTCAWVHFTITYYIADSGNYRSHWWIVASVDCSVYWRYLHFPAYNFQQWICMFIVCDIIYISWFRNKADYKMTSFYPPFTVGRVRWASRSDMLTCTISGSIYELWASK